MSSDDRLPEEVEDEPRVVLESSLSLEEVESEDDSVESEVVSSFDVEEPESDMILSDVDSAISAVEVADGS